MSTNTILVGILQIKNQIFGSKKDKYQYLFRPFNHEEESLLVWSKINRTREPANILCQVEKTEQQSAKASCARYGTGVLRQKVGHVNNLDDLRRAFLYHYQLVGSKTTFPVVSRLPSDACEHTDPSGYTGPSDHTDRMVYSIDPIGCRDIDDAFSLVELGSSSSGDETCKWLLTIYIANLDRTELTPVALASLARPFSLYLEDGTLNMWGDAVTEEASLTPKEKRSAVALELKLNQEGKLTGYQFLVTTIVNRRAWTYDEVDQKLKESDSYFQNLRNLVRSLESEIKGLDDHSDISVCFDSHKIIEVLMLLYNKLACESLLKSGFQPILRVHPAPLKSTLPSMWSFLEYESSRYVWSEKSSLSGDFSHHGLGLKHYGHFTSPLRRLVDFYNQQLLITLATNEQAAHFFCGGLVTSDSGVLEAINDFEARSRKYYRRQHLLKLSKEYQLPQKVTLIPYEKLQSKGDQDVLEHEVVHYQCYWPQEGIRVKVKTQNARLTLFEPVVARLAIVNTDLPRVRVEL